MKQVRWTIRRDMLAVLQIEQDSFEFTWSEDEFMRVLRQRNCIGMVYDNEDQITGYMIYELQKTQLRLLNFAVSPQYRRQGIGTAMIQKLIKKLTPPTSALHAQKRRTKIILNVRETNLNAQLFFRQMGFYATATLRNYYEDTEEDAYTMEYQIPQIQNIETIMNLNSTNEP